MFLPNNQGLASAFCKPYNDATLGLNINFTNSTKPVE
jgi:hypothetical protein